MIEPIIVCYGVFTLFGVCVVTTSCNELPIRGTREARVVGLILLALGWPVAILYWTGRHVPHALAFFARGCRDLYRQTRPRKSGASLPRATAYRRKAP